MKVLIQVFYKGGRWDGVKYDAIEIDPEDDIEDPHWASAIGADVRNMVRDMRTKEER